MSNINTGNLENLRDTFRNYSEHAKRILDAENIQVICYPNYREKKLKRSLTVREVINEIKTGTWLKSLKKDDLPICYFSVTDFTGAKENDNAIDHTGLIVVDIDKKDNPDIDFMTFKAKLKQWRYAFACFTSPSGGLKLIIKTGIYEKSQHLGYFYGLEQFVKECFPEIIKIDGSGCNIARACFLPHDIDAYMNPKSSIYNLNPNEIERYSKEHIKPIRNGLKVLLQVEELSTEDHIDNLMNLIHNRTSVGYYSDLKLCAGKNIDTLKRTLVGYSTHLETSVGYYDNIFNKYRYKYIEKGVMRTNVPILEILILKNSYPYKLDFKTSIDEAYYLDTNQTKINLSNIGNKNGIEFCEIKKFSHGIKKGARHRTIAIISMKLIYNNPFCYPSRLLEVLLQINAENCEDPDPRGNPKPSEEEVRGIFENNYSKFINGTLDFSKTIRAKKAGGKPTRKYVFTSRKHVKRSPEEEKKEGDALYAENRREDNIRLYEEAIHELQDGKKITVKRIAEYMGLSTKQVSRYRKDIRYNEKMLEFQKVIDNYNTALKKIINKGSPKRHSNHNCKSTKQEIPLYSEPLATQSRP